MGEGLAAEGLVVAVAVLEPVEMGLAVLVEGVVGVVDVEPVAECAVPALSFVAAEQPAPATRPSESRAAAAAVPTRRAIEHLRCVVVAPTLRRLPVAARGRG